MSHVGDSHTCMTDPFLHRARTHSEEGSLTETPAWLGSTWGHYPCPQELFTGLRRDFLLACVVVSGFSILPKALSASTGTSLSFLLQSAHRGATRMAFPISSPPFFPDVLSLLSSCFLPHTFLGSVVNPGVYDGSSLRPERGGAGPGGVDW